MLERDPDQIRERGLWLVNELCKEPLSPDDVAWLQCEQKSRRVEPDEAALFPLVVDHVEGVKEGRDPRIRAYQRNDETDDKGRSKRVVSLLGYHQDLIRDELKDAEWKYPG